MSSKASVVTVVAVYLLGACSFLLFFCFSHAASADGFNKVVIGMTKDRVQELLGPPLGGSTDSCLFAYGGFQKLKWCTMEIQFRPDGRVFSKFHDH